MLKTLRIAALMLALCCPALAGEIPNPPTPQPQSITVEEPSTTDGNTTETTETLTQIALDLTLTVLSII